MQRLRLRDPTTRRSCSYLFDWVFCVILLILFFLLDRVEPFHREFSVENPAIMYPYQEKERVPVWGLVLIAVVFPVILMAVVALGVRRSPYDLHNGILGLLLSILLTTMFMQVIKVTVGKHRPDFLSRCMPVQGGAVLVKNPPLQLWTVAVCTQTDKHILRDGMRAFPSGHASNYRHSGVDVTWGAIIGIVFAFFAYLQYYPSLTSTHSQVPHPPRDFSNPITNEQGRNEEPSRLENAIGIRPNDEFVNESRPYPLPQARGIIDERAGGAEADWQQTNNQAYNNHKDNSGNQFTRINIDSNMNHGANGIDPGRRNDTNHSALPRV
ncbi:hypothetical protein BGZ51_009470 [Haplosporangium sp. Z 767]|nr:hypothetical protein BGZ51_009470 [Haplosporangium sp. Z 767]